MISKDNIFLSISLVALYGHTLVTDIYNDMGEARQLLEGPRTAPEAFNIK
jgi:hypothetical protein